MKGFKFLNAAQYAALDAAGKAAYDLLVIAFAKLVGIMEISVAIRKIAISASNPNNCNIITAVGENNPYLGGVVPMNTKMLNTWAKDNGLTPVAFRMLLNQGGGTLTGTARVVLAGESFEKKDGTTDTYKCPSLRLENPAIEIGGTFGKTVAISLANTAVAAAMMTANVADDDDVAYGG
jgi:hypothetical protein